MSLRRLLLVLAALLIVVAPVRSQGGAFFFIQLSDPQFGMYTADKEFAQETANFEFAVATVNRLKPAFVVITGDLVNKPGDAAQIAEYERIKAKVSGGIPVYDMPGKGMRYVRNSIGVDTVVVNGQVAYRDNDYTKARSGTICT